MSLGFCSSPTQPSHARTHAHTHTQFRKHTTCYGITEKESREDLSYVESHDPHDVSQFLLLLQHNPTQVNHKVEHERSKKPVGPLLSDHYSTKNREESQHVNKCQQMISRGLPK